jgi:hypothetical protein
LGGAYKRLRKADRYEDFRMLPEETEDEIVFFGGKDYIALFCESTRDVKMNGQCFTIRHSRQHAGEIRHHDQNKLRGT